MSKQHKFTFCLQVDDLHPHTCIFEKVHRLKTLYASSTKKLWYLLLYFMVLKTFESMLSMVSIEQFLMW